MRRALAIAALGLGLLATGCGGTDDSTPVACLEGSGAYLRALEDAPGAVRLDGETPISDCLAENQGGGDLAAVGTAMLATATKLNAAGRARPSGEAPLQLGYLIGAVQRGAEQTEGIHDELLRRLGAAATYKPHNRPSPESLVRAYREGFIAGRAGG